MNLLKLSLRMLRRDWRAGELRVLAFALVIAVGGMTTVGFFADRVQLALSRQGNQLLGADLIIFSDHPLPPHYAAEAKRHGPPVRPRMWVRALTNSNPINPKTAIAAMKPPMTDAPKRISPAFHRKSAESAVSPSAYPVTL